MPRNPLILTFSLAILLCSSHAFPQSSASRALYIEYIRAYKDIAVQKMNEYRIPASITLAQGILESGSGKSDLTVNANNHFGIKCHKEWTGMTYTMDDDERNECFRKYASAEESFNDHSFFLTSRPRYAGLFLLDIRDYKGWAYGLKSAGYATNPRYAEMLIKIIEENELYLFDGVPTGPFAKKEENDAPVKKISKPEKNVKPTSYQFVEVAEGNRKIYENNGVRLTYARTGDDVHTISKDLGIHAFQLLRYNELGKNETLSNGQVIYVEPKKKKGAEETHVFLKGENMRDVSQHYGIRLKALYKKNGMPEGHEPEPGTKLYLRKNKP